MGQARQFTEFSFTPSQGVEMVSYVALKNNGDTVYNNLRDLTLMGIVRQERNFSLANYITNIDLLKMLFRVSGLEQYAYDCGENIAMRQYFGITDRPVNVADGFFIAAYEKGLISRYRLNCYFEDKPGFRANDYCIRQDAVVWLAKLYNIQPSFDYSFLNRFQQIHLVSPENKPYYAGVLKAGISVSVAGTSLFPCRLMNNSELITLITGFYPYLLATNKIESKSDYVSCVTVSEDGAQVITLASGDEIVATPDNTCLVAGNGFVDNTYVFWKGEATEIYTQDGPKITYFIKDNKIMFITTSMKSPEYSYGSIFTGKLYFYDDLTSQTVFCDEKGNYTAYFPVENTTFWYNNNILPVNNLLDFTDTEFEVSLMGVNKYSMKKIIQLRK